MRLRLARQRAAPSRVRARERAEEPESGLKLGRFNLLALEGVKSDLPRFVIARSWY